MTGTLTFYIVTKSATDTYGDIKDILLPLIQAEYNRLAEDNRLDITEVPYLFRRNQLVLYNDDHVRFDDDYAPIPPSKKIIELNVHVDNEIEPEWTREEKDIIYELDVTSTPSFYSVDTPGKIAAFVHSMKNKDSDLTKKNVESLLFYYTDMVPAIMDNIRQFTFLERFHIAQSNFIDIPSLENLLIENKTIKNLILSDNRMDRVKMHELFEMIGRNNTLKTLTIDGLMMNADRRSAYRMNDLVESLRQNSSLRNVLIENCDVEIDEKNLTKLADLLYYQFSRPKHLKKLSFKFSSHLTLKHIIEILLDNGRERLEKFIKILQYSRNNFSMVYNL
jgi:hypothetical protein